MPSAQWLSLLLIAAFPGSPSVGQHTEPPPKAKPADEIERLTSQLASDNVDERVESVRRLSELNRERVLTPLMLALRDGNRRVKKEAAIALGKIGDPRALGSLQEFFYRHGSPPYLRDSYMAINALAMIGASSREAGAKAAKAILDAMRDEARIVYGEVQDQYCQIAVDALIRIGDAAVGECIGALKDRERCVRLIAARALGNTTDSVALQPLVRALDDDDAAVRILAARALGNFRETASAQALVQRVRNDDGIHFRTAAMQSLVRIGTHSLKPLVVCLADEEDCYLAAWAAQTLGETGDRQAVPFLIEALENPAAVVRCEAIRALGRLGDPVAAKPVARLLGDTDAAVRSAAARAIGQLSARDSTPAVIQLLKDREWQVRVAAADAVGSLQDLTASKALEMMLDDPELTVRVAAALALGNLRVTACVPRLTVLLDDSNPSLVAAAATALSNIGTRPAQTALFNALRATTRPARESIAAGLGRAGDADTLQRLSETAAKDDSVRLRVLIRTALAASAEAGVGILYEMGRHPSSEVRRLAIGALSDMSREKAVAALLDFLPSETDPLCRQDIEAGVLANREVGAAALVRALKSDHAEVRDLAMRALGQTSGARVIPLYAEALADAHVQFRHQIIRLLAARREKEAVEPLIRALQHDDQFVAAAAAHALGQIKDTRAIEPLAEILRSATGEVRWACVCGLGEMRDIRVIDPLLEILKTTRDDDIKRACIGLLGHTRQERLYDALAAYATEQKFREAALYAMGEIGTDRAVQYLLALLNNAEEDSMIKPDKRFIITALGQSRNRLAAGGLIAFVTEDEERRHFAWDVGRALGNIGEPALDAVIALLKGRNLELRLAAAEAMAQIGGRAAIEPLLMTLRWGDAPICLAAIEGLHRIGDPRALGPLQQLADQHPDERVRGKARETAKKLKEQAK